VLGPGQAVSMVPKPVGALAVAAAAMPKKESLASLRARELEEVGSGGGPTTTVFVGNISEKASDMLVRQLLAVSPVLRVSLSRGVQHAAREPGCGPRADPIRPREAIRSY